MAFLSSVPFWIIALLMLGILILVHESGHFLIGRLLKFKINEFAIGMGPKILSKEKKGIVYSLRLIPMGGCVAFHGEDEDGEDDPEAMNNQKWYKRALVMFAGAGFNLLFAYLVTAILTCAIGYSLPKLEEIQPQSALYGVAQEGDVVVAVGSERLVSAGQLSDELGRYGSEDTFTLTLLRNGEERQMEAKKYRDAETGRYLVGVSYGVETVNQNIFQALGYSARYNVWMTKTMYRTLWQLVTGQVSLENVTGPISTIGAIGGIMQDTAQEESVPASERVRAVVVMVMELLVIISVNLAVMNLLPIPALDGFRLLFALFEGITKKHIPRKTEGMINAIGLIVLVGAMVLLEVSKLF